MLERVLDARVDAHTDLGIVVIGALHIHVIHSTMSTSAQTNTANYVLIYDGPVRHKIVLHYTTSLLYTQRNGQHTASKFNAASLQNATNDNIVYILDLTVQVVRSTISAYYSSSMHIRNVPADKIGLFLGDCRIHRRLHQAVQAISESLPVQDSPTAVLSFCIAGIIDTTTIVSAEVRFLSQPSV